VAAHTGALGADALVARLNAVGIASGRVNEVADLLEHPQLAARDRWRPVETPAGTVRGLLPPFTIAGVELPMGHVPALGEHTEAVLRGLGYSAEQIAALNCGGANRSAGGAG
jgi:crotonobetainyl-CoA:carnitine CoA-transferase CaiB-like acyl-CoA transferase